MIIHGDCVEEMRRMPEASVDAIVTDPPYGLGFMGKAWDDLPPGKEWAEECLRVLKPGGHLLAFGGTRTWHRLAVAIEDAGFEIRDSIAWMYGSGFPKSMDVSKAIDKAAGAEREVVGHYTRGVGSPPIPGNSNDSGLTTDNWRDARLGEAYEVPITAPATPDAEQWQGWGTALKPAFEPVVVARKPLSVDGKATTVAANVLAHGTGALNIDGCRIGVGDSVPGGGAGRGSFLLGGCSSFAELAKLAEEDGVTPNGETARLVLERHSRPRASDPHNSGRFPANVILDESQAAALDQQSGFSKSPPVGSVANKVARIGQVAKGNESARVSPNGHGDSGGASRFFYVAKAPKKERPVVDGVAHPTVKPLALMRYLVRLVTPPGGTVLEPFAGSGTTIEAALLEGFDVIGIERDEAYLPLIQARIDRVTEQGIPKDDLQDTLV